MKILDEAGNRVSSLDTIVPPGVVVVSSSVLWFVDRFLPVGDIKRESEGRRRVRSEN